VIFALVSLPLASSAIIYFINHRYDGAQLWDVKLVPGTLYVRDERKGENVCVWVCAREDEQQPYVCF